jgi:hypothetical protein
LTDVLRIAVAFFALLSGATAAPASEIDLAQKVDLLIAAYPDTLERREKNRLFFRDGGPPMNIDDGRTKDHATKLAEGDIEDSLLQLYPAGSCETVPTRNGDPGRIRSEPLLKRLYGSSKNQVAQSVRTVDWFGQSVKVTTRNGVAAALEAVRDELERQPDLKPYLIPSAGTFNWRKVAGAPNLSVHSFAAAIDLNTNHADYWLWSGGKPGNVPRYKNRFPMEIVESFERHGFIWGGRWYHYDTMHFEYRPELLAIARVAGSDACR